MLQILIPIAMKIVDFIFTHIPQPVPDRTALNACKIISHRGEHDNIKIFENTMPAFLTAQKAGVWGIECDIRWTRDLVPVIYHDTSLLRLYGKPESISELSFQELRALVPAVPSLEELASQFGKKSHLMIEIKDELYPEPERQKLILQKTLSGLSPGKDYHFLSLDPDLFEKVDFIPRQYMYPVSEVNFNRLSKISLNEEFGGLTGHFLLLHNRLKSRHEQYGQNIGTGFIKSRNCLFRELNRGIEWIFSNDAIELQQIINDCEKE